MLRLVAGAFRFVPFRVVYVLSDGLAFFLYRILGYRKKVVFDNLRRSFPEKNDAELTEIARRFYQNLTDITLESIKLFTISLAEATRRAPPRNPELLNKYLDQGQPVILCGSHYNNWEITGLSMPLAFNGTTITAFKPLTNKILDRYLNANRSRATMEMVAMNDLFSTMRKRGKEPVVFILLSDQSPSSPKSAHWVPFLGQETASLPGADVLARKFNFPVLYYDTQRLRRGFYEVHFSELWPDPTTAQEGDISRAYARQLEQIIRHDPANWLWSHKRWKIKKV